MTEAEALRHAEKELLEKIQRDALPAIADWLEALQNYYIQHIDDEARFEEKPSLRLRQIERGEMDLPE